MVATSHKTIPRYSIACLPVQSPVHMEVFFPRLLVCLQVFVFLAMNLQWLRANATGNATDQLALLNFKEGITDDPHGVLNSWNHSLPFCNWFGITCSRQHQRVTSLVLEGQNLAGVISPYVGNLSFLRILDLRNNSLHGDIPQEIGNLFRLQEVSLNNNTLEGKIPVNLSRCSQLWRIDLFYNNLAGNIPAELGSLAMLQLLRLGSNKLTGEIPPALGNLSSLTYFTASYNNLVGNIPDEFSRLKRLFFLSIGINRLSGMIPLSIFNISSINTLSAPKNQLHGNLPDNIGLTLPNLQQLSLGGNELSGSIPTSLANASQLQQLDLPFNNLIGQVPNLGNSQDLWWLNIGINQLGGDSANDLAFLTSLNNCSNLQILDFSHNQFQGVLPESVSNLSIQLSELYMGANQISGTIPNSLEHLVNLTVLGMGENLFTGVVPSYFGKFQKLQGLGLSRNRLSGVIPSSIGSLTQFFELYLQGNNFEGRIPSAIGNCQNLQSLDISQNSLHGPIPVEVFGLSSLTKLNLSQNSLSGNLSAQLGKLRNVYSLDFSENNISGEIPSTIGDCSSLESVYLQGNSFEGTVPSSLISLKGLLRLDLSQNNLTGKIPEELQNITVLEYLNISFNHLEGEVPTEGIYKNASAISLIGNYGLCGGVAELHLLKCPTRSVKTGRSVAFKLAIIIPCVLLFFLLIALFVISRNRRSHQKKSCPETPTMGYLAKVSYRELCQATDEFSQSNLIGWGSFGSVYKGTFGQGEEPVAVKVLDLQKKGASKSFIAECRALANVRHRNLVKILTYCSSLDYMGNDFKALVYEFMGNGSLDKWLHPEVESQNAPRNLKLSERVNIATDVASALYYLHDLCEYPIIHCDLKPSNVLLDKDMNAHVGDFGLSMLLSPVSDVPEIHSSSVAIKGTIGYVAPEYGMGGEASKEADAYSYGILLLEMFTGRSPTDERFRDGRNLRNFVKAALPGKLVQVIDPTLLATLTEEAVEEGGDIEIEEEEEEEDDNEEKTNHIKKYPRKMTRDVQKCLSFILELGVACSAESPGGRMSTGDVSRRLQSIKDTLLDDV